METGVETAYRVIVKGALRRPTSEWCVFSQRNPSGRWDAVYITERRNLKEILVRSQGAVHVQIRESRPDDVLPLPPPAVAAVP
jgi:hypothetical protein